MIPGGIWDFSVRVSTPHARGLKHAPTQACGRFLFFLPPHTRGLKAKDWAPCYCITFFLFFSLPPHARGLKSTDWAPCQCTITCHMRPPAARYGVFFFSMHLLICLFPGIVLWRLFGGHLPFVGFCLLSSSIVVLSLSFAYYCLLLSIFLPLETTIHDDSCPFVPVLARIAT